MAEKTTEVVLVEELLSRIADKYHAIYEIDHSITYRDMGESQNNTAWYNLEYYQDEIIKLKQDLLYMNYNPDMEIVKNLLCKSILKIHLSLEDILHATKLCNTDDMYNVSFQAFNSKNGKTSTYHVWIYMDNDYTSRDDIFWQDIINSCWAIADFFGVHFIKIIQWHKSETVNSQTILRRNHHG